MIAGCAITIIPDSVTSIGNYAFQNTGKLTSITLPDSVNSIGKYAFSNCGLKDITIPSKVTSLESHVFYQCKELTSVTLYRNITKIGEYAFCGCKKLEKIDIPVGVEKINKYAFKGCVLFNKITIPGTVNTIGSYSFDDCADIKKIIISEGVKKIGSKAFYDCKNAEVVLPSSINSIGTNAFNKKSELTVVEGSYADNWAIEKGYIIIPSGVNEIGEQAFDKNVIIIVTEGSYAEKWALNNGYSVVRKNGSILINKAKKAKFKVTSDNPANLTVEYIGTTDNKAKSIVIPDSVKIDNVDYKVTGIGNKALNGKKKLKKVIIGNNITYIGKRSFAKCKNLKLIYVKSNSLTTIGKNAIKGINEKAVIKVPKQLVKNYKKIFTSKTGYKKSIKFKKYKK